MGDLTRLRVIALLDNPFVLDQRVHREVTSLAAAGHRVTLLATGAPGLPAIEHFEGVELRREVPQDVLKFRDAGAVQRLATQLAAQDFDVIHCHDHLMLRVGAAVKRRRKDVCLVYDSHELLHGWPLNLDEGTTALVRMKSRLARRLAISRERRDARMADFVITVNDSLADDLMLHLGRRERPTVLRNAPRLVALPPKSKYLRERFAIPGEQRILVFVRSRLHTRTLNLEVVLDQFKGRPDVALVFISGQPLAGNEVMTYARERGCLNAHFHEAIPPAEVIPTLAAADVGLVPTWNRQDISYWYALDNKVFDYVAAGLPLLATLQPEYRRIVEGYGVGVCVNPDEPNAYVRGFDAVLADEPKFRAASVRAREQLCWEGEAPQLLALYKQAGAPEGQAIVTRVAVQQPNYFPWIGYFHKMVVADTFVLLDNVEFQGGNAASVTNRTTIKTSQGVQKITVPVLHGGPSRLVQDIRIDTRQPWQKKHIGALRAAYGRAPAFEEVFPMVAATIEAAGDSLAVLNQQSIGLACSLLGIDRPIVIASSLSLSATEKSARIVEICERVGASTYLSGGGGRSYNDEELFRSHGIALEYSRFEAREYPQLHGSFVPNLSVLDALFSCGRGARRLMGPQG